MGVIHDVIAASVCGWISIMLISLVILSLLLKTPLEASSASWRLQLKCVNNLWHIS